ncbi:AraC family transcriptional regulator [Hymenobacter sp. RP-2-7]|uniref:AraC family transcriptional regulator n=1 Tax=Hymenobacter polaris TaxID=2682546 RepID=A0A7Y0ADS4_9BACT|nr:helix-turn-helix domain-containing protein [Hymenobacter polaris]NML65469.1 AraC family transcriptional regulator [Hymenobacter polaris]
MSFHQYQPCASLQPYVELLAVQETTGSQAYTVLPSPKVVLGFQYRGTLAYYAAARTELATAGITGICSEFRVFENSPHTGTVLVVFKPGGAAPFFRSSLHELFQQSIALADVVPRPALAHLQEQLDQAQAADERVRLVEAFLLAQLQPTGPDQLVQAALRSIYHANGLVRMTTLARQLGTSSSPLEKRFRRALGATPKKVASIVQLTHAISQYRAGQSLTELSHATGFYDQAHFIHAFRAFTGQAPAAYFKSELLG